MKKFPVLLILLTLMAMTLLLWQAQNPLWQTHLQADTVIYHARVSFFLAHHSWAGLQGNEYQPGALWWMLLPALLPVNSENYEAFLTAFWGVNLLLIAAHVAFARKFGPPEAPWAPWVMLAMVAAIGPILLYRFELIVSFMVLGAWLFWKRECRLSASFLLGLATATKMYPLILLPPLTVQAVRLSGLTGGLRTLVGFALGVLTPVFALLFSGSTFADIASALNFHRDKPIGLDGLAGSLLPMAQHLLQIPLRMTPRNSIHGFETDIPLLGPLMDWLWIPLYLGVLALILCKLPKGNYADASVFFSLLMAFLMLQKNDNPQYAWWVASLIPMISLTWLSRRAYGALVFLACVSLLLAQLAYPLRYQNLLDAFYGGRAVSSPIFLINMIKNLCWLAVMLTGLAPLFRTGAPTLSEPQHPVP